MTEDEYIIVTNRAKVSTAMSILRDVMPPDDKKELAEWRKIIVSLENVEARLWEAINIRMTETRR
ncbi:MAG: hypothetical protein WBP41_04835 [Saprospiraceae bacterium]